MAEPSPRLPSRRVRAPAGGRDLVKQPSVAQLDRLAVIYAVERQDDQNSFVSAIALITIAVTYMCAAAAYVGDKCGSTASCSRFPFPYVQYAAPIIPLTLTGFLALNLARTLLRSSHLLRLEEALSVQLRSGFVEPKFHSNSVAIYSAQRDRHEPGKPAGFRSRLAIAVAVLPYGAYLLAVLAFTFGVMVPNHWGILKILAIVIYISLFAAEVFVAYWPPKGTVPSHGM